MPATRSTNPTSSRKSGKRIENFMKKRIFTAGFIFLTIFLFQSPARGQHDEDLKFTDGQKRALINDVGEKSTIINISEKEFEATLTSFGKANPLNDKLLDKLKAKNKKIYNQTKKIKTSFNLTQNGRYFYIRGFNSIDLSQFRGDGFKVKCRVFLIEIRSKDKQYYLPIIAAIRQI